MNTACFGASNVTSRTDNDGSVTDFGYNRANQLTSETRTLVSPYTITYTYDGNGNRLTKVLNNVTESYSYDFNDKLTSTGGKTYQYDNNGNCTSVTSGGQTTSLTYDYSNGVTRIDYPGGSYNTFQYNGLGLRTRKVDSAGTFNYVCDGTSPAAPVLSDSAAVYTPGESERRGTTSKWYHGDSLGSTRGITGSTQSATDSILYYGFGMTLSRTGTTPTPFGFVGAGQYQTDADSGLQLLGHRYYDPSVGRFITQDPIRDGRNWYAYCSNNPLGGTDPSGLYVETAADVVGTALDVRDFINDPSLANGAAIIGDLGGILFPGLPSVGVVRHGDEAVGIIGSIGTGLGRLIDKGKELVGGAIDYIGGLFRKCFAAGTLIVMADGSTKPIEKIQVGDTVLTRDDQLDERAPLAFGRVTRSFTREASDILIVAFENGKTLKTTAEHPFFVLGKGFAPAKMLTKGATIAGRNGIAARVKSIKAGSKQTRVFNFEVRGYHSYFVMVGERAIWVHNECFTPDQQAAIELAKEARRRGPMDPDEASTLVDMAQEVGLPARGPESHPGRPHGKKPHIHVGPVNHIWVK